MNPCASRRKKTFRDLVKKVAPEFNPEYFGQDQYNTYQEQFNAIKKMGGDVMIKAVAGGGGARLCSFQDRF